MAITKRAGITSLSTRKEVKKVLTLQLENALTDLKKELGEEKFHLRLKKAVKALTKDFEGVHEDEDEKAQQEESITEKLPLKVKKAAIKKSAKKKAVKASYETEDAKTPGEDPIAEKLPIKGKKAAIKKSAKNKADKASHSTAPSKVH